jgi:hypothetical protein
MVMMQSSAESRKVRLSASSVPAGFSILPRCQRFEHRREILRAIQRDADANSNCNYNSYGYGDSDSDTDGYLNAQFNGDIHSNCDADSDVKSESYTGSTSSTHSGTASIR